MLPCAFGWASLFFFNPCFFFFQPIISQRVFNGKKKYEPKNLLDFEIKNFKKSRDF
jgi:hypothetical protein